MIDAALYIESPENTRILIDKEVRVRWVNQSLDHYKSLGYEYTKLGDYFIASSFDLLPFSRVRLRVMCGKCGEIRTVGFNDLQGRNNTLCVGCINTSDLEGKRFGRLVVLRRVFRETSKRSPVKWECRCDCGKIKIASSPSLKIGNTKSCGCLHVEATKIANSGHRNRLFKDLKGQRFGKLVAVEYVGDSKWLCDCDCGRRTVKPTDRLTGGTAKNCGNGGPHRGGVESAFWDSGKTKEERRKERKEEGYSLWKQEVLLRDGRACRIEGCKRGSLEIHHIYGYTARPDLSMSLDNGITLCHYHHRQKNGVSFHNLFGQDNTNEDSFRKWIDETGLSLRSLELGVTNG